MTNLGQGGIRTIPYEVMASVLPLLSEVTEHGDRSRPVDCLQRSVCSANRRLASNYGKLGKVFAKFASEAVLEHFHSLDPVPFREAASNGRNLIDCHAHYTQCPTDWKSTRFDGPAFRTDITSFFIRRLESSFTFIDHGYLIFLSVNETISGGGGRNWLGGVFILGGSRSLNYGRWRQGFK